MLVYCCCRARRPASLSRPPSDTELPAIPPPAKIRESYGLQHEPSYSQLKGKLHASSQASLPAAGALAQSLLLNIDDTDSDDEDNGGTSKRSIGTGTLDAVKTKLARHLSQEPDSKRCSTM